MNVGIPSAVLGLQHGKAEYAQNAVREATPFEQMADAANSALELVARIEELVAHLAGSSPPQPASVIGANTAPADGLLRDYGYRAVHVRSRIADAHQALDRLDRCIR